MIATIIGLPWESGIKLCIDVMGEGRVMYAMDQSRVIVKSRTMQQ